MVARLEVHLFPMPGEVEDDACTPLAPCRACRHWTETEATAAARLADPGDPGPAPADAFFGDLSAGEGR